MKPEALTDEDLWDLEVESGMPLFRAYQGLWMCADREGRFEWRPRNLKLHCLPYWDGDFEAALEALASRSYVVRYTVDGKDYGCVRTLAKHQRFDHREPPSSLPAPIDHARARPGDAEPSSSACPGPARVEGKGRELEGKGSGTEGASARVTLPSPDDLTEPASYTRVPEWWKPTDALYAEAQLAGVPRALLDEDVTYWRARRLGGEFHDIDQFFRAHFPRLAKRRETESFKQTKHGSAQPNAGKTGWE